MPSGGRPWSAEKRMRRSCGLHGSGRRRSRPSASLQLLLQQLQDPRLLALLVHQGAARALPMPMALQAHRAHHSFLATLCHPLLAQLQLS